MHFWPRLDRASKAFWNPSRIESWSTSFESGESLIQPASAEAFRLWAADNREWARSTVARAEGIRSGHFQVFDTTCKFALRQIPWNTDWRYGFTWPSGYYRDYQFYGHHKSVPYDVRLPWELSRMDFLLQLSQATVITGDPVWKDLIFRIVQDWDRRNPVAYSVNWHPMECSMRSIFLALSLQILATDPGPRGEEMALLLRLLTLHGEFIRRNVEYTDIRGNHYAANLVALLLIGHTLRRVYPSAEAWWHYALRRIPRELQLQYCPDGVNFEKSSCYHVLVTELFLIALLLMQKEGVRVPDAYERTMRLACEFVCASMQPNGTSPNFGDNDSARAILFDTAPRRDFRSLLALGAVVFRKPEFNASATRSSASIPWLTGESGCRRWMEMNGGRSRPSRSRYFSAGGFLVSRDKDNVLVSDCGEVGQRGLGGHGHNDTFSFTLTLQGQPVIVDSGSPVYTGDERAYNQFRASASHNVLTVNGLEMAELRGMWRIAPDATPHELSVRLGNRYDSYRGAHSGYTGLSSPAIHSRRIRFYKEDGVLVCLDRIRGHGCHLVQQHLHFAPGCRIVLDSQQLVVEWPDSLSVVVQWRRGTDATLETCQVSHTYGQIETSHKVVLSRTLHETKTMYFAIRPLDQATKARSFARTPSYNHMRQHSSRVRNGVRESLETSPRRPVTATDSGIGCGGVAGPGPT